jgi:hypothetical protein
VIGFELNGEDPGGALNSSHRRRGSLNLPLGLVTT